LKNEIFITYGQVEKDSILCLLEEGIGLYELQIPSSEDIGKKAFIVEKTTNIDERILCESFNKKPYDFEYKFR
jgi:hypothetical protein